MPWLRISFFAARKDVEALTDRLEGLDVTSISLSDGAGEAVIDSNFPTERGWSRTRFEALVGLQTPLKPIHEVLDRFEIAEVSTSFVADEEWEENWKQVVHPRTIGGIQVIPHGTVGSTQHIAIKIVPGLAFGTGEHPTTTMCLEWLQSIDLLGLSVLDFGTGSGILAIAAKKLGAERVVAIDNDPVALRVARENATTNDVEIEIESALKDQSQFDVIVSNIVLSTLVEHAQQLTSKLAPRGHIGLTGLIDGQQNPVRNAYSNIELSSSMQSAEWVLLAGQSNDLPEHG